MEKYVSNHTVLRQVGSEGVEVIATRRDTYLNTDHRWRNDRWKKPYVARRESFFLDAEIFLISS